LLFAAVRAFGRSGYEARLEDIAAEAGVTRPSLLHHFASKDELYAAALRHAFGELETTLERAVLENGDFEQRLRRLVDALEACARDNLALLAVVIRGSLREDDVIARREVERCFSPLVDRLEGFVRFGAHGRIPRRFPVRAAILQLVFAHLVRAAMGPTGEALWKGEAHTWTLTRALLAGALDEAPAAARPADPTPLPSPRRTDEPT
jgi:AcrR family transcriptional regulator